jgi:hypothetical protein
MVAENAEFSKIVVNFVERTKHMLRNEYRPSSEVEDWDELVYIEDEETPRKAISWKFILFCIAIVGACGLIGFYFYQSIGQSYALQKENPPSSEDSVTPPSQALENYELVPSNPSTPTPSIPTDQQNSLEAPPAPPPTPNREETPVTEEQKEQERKEQETAKNTSERSQKKKKATKQKVEKPKQSTKQKVIPPPEEDPASPKSESEENEDMYTATPESIPNEQYILVEISPPETTSPSTTPNENKMPLPLTINYGKPWSQQKISIETDDSKSEGNTPLVFDTRLTILPDGRIFYPENSVLGQIPVVQNQADPSIWQDPAKKEEILDQLVEYTISQNSSALYWLNKWNLPEEVLRELQLQLASQPSQHKIFGIALTQETEAISLAQITQIQQEDGVHHFFVIPKEINLEETPILEQKILDKEQQEVGSPELNNS